MTDDAGGAPGGGSGEWRTIESVVEYETGWYEGGYDLVEQPDGTRKKYYWAELAPAVVVVALTGRPGDREREVVFVEQYRPPIGAHCLELPAGIVEDGETYVEAGARELREETGFDPGRIELLEDYWVATGVMRHRRGIAFATDLSAVDRRLDSNEFIEVTRIPVGEALERAREEPANDATIEGLLLAAADGHLDG